MVRLLADIGGTNARFALQRPPLSRLEQVHVLACADYATLDDAIAHYLSERPGPPPGECAIAIATPVLGDRVRMTNHHWAFSIQRLQNHFGFTRLLVVNDFTALAWALPTLAGDDLRPIWLGRSVSCAPLALVGPGTGLGVSGLLPDARGGWLPLESEGGHVTLAGCTAREQAVLHWLAQCYGHASAEQIYEIFTNNVMI